MSTQPKQRQGIDDWMVRRRAEVEESQARKRNVHVAASATRPTQVSRPAGSPSPNGRATPPTAHPATGASPSSIGHPGFAESLIPVWGSGREAIAEWQEGDYVSALINAGLAASDVFVGGAILKGIGKGMIKKMPSGGGWSVRREWLKKEGWIKPDHEGHHVFIPQGWWGRTWPDAMKNHPLNIKSLPKDVHRRITGRWDGQRRFNPAQQFWYGTPAWTKVGIGGVGADGVQGLDDRKR